MSKYNIKIKAESSLNVLELNELLSNTFPFWEAIEVKHD